MASAGAECPPSSGLNRGCSLLRSRRPHLVCDDGGQVLPEPLAEAGDKCDGQSEVVRRLRLGCAAEVAVMESADLGQGNDASLLAQLDSPRLGSILLEPEVRARAVVVAQLPIEPSALLVA